MTNILASTKKLFARSRRTRFVAARSAFACLIAVATSATATQFKEARVTQIVNDVKLLLQQAAPRPAVVSDLVRTGSAVRTGSQSRSELTFADLTITRLGANTIFSFNQGTREMNLIDGAILFQVPKGKGGATIKTAGVTVSITGTTGIGEFHPATASNPQPFSKWLCLEGTFRLILPNGQSLELGPGKMAVTDGKSFSKVSTFDIGKLVKTSLFFTGFDTPLASLNLIALEEQNQLDLKLASDLVAATTTNPLDPTQIINVINQAVVAEEASQTPLSPPPPPPPPTPPPPTPPPPTPPPPTPPPPTPTPPPPTPTPPPPTPTPSKFGPPTTITSPVPYLITSGTVITTDPAITTNGVTNFGTIYRGVTDDGAFTLWAFGSTSAFDTALGIDDVFFADPNHLPIAVFKFQSLSLNGNPIIDTSNGGGTKLGLIGVDGITSGPPGGILTFTGLDLLVLATVNGSINLTSDVSFQGLSELSMYARGAGSDLILDSPISNIGILELAAEGSIQLTNPGTMSVGELDATAGNNLTLQIGGSLLLDGKVRLDTLVLPGTTVATGANLTLNVTGDYTNSSATEFSRLQVTNQGHIGTGGNIAVNIGGNLTATGLGSATESPEPGDFVALVQNTNALIDNGGNLNLTVNGNVQVNGLAAYVQNYDFTANPAGHIGTGGNIDIEIGGNLTANSYVDVFLNNRGGGMIDSGGNLTFNVSGALTIGVDQFTNGFSAEFIVSSRYDDVGGNTTPSFIGSDVSLFLHAASVDMAGVLFGSGISNRGGSIIDGNATVTWDVPGDVTIQGTTNIMPGSSGASWFVLNDIPPDYQFTPPSGGIIHGNATLTLTIGGDLTIAGDALIDIENQRNLLFTGPSGGTIDSDATLNITAANISVGGELDVLIDNFNNGSGSGSGGSIGGNAAINLNLSGNLTTTGSDPNSGGIPGDAYFLIRNGSFVEGSPGGFIGGDATIDLNIVNVSIAGLFDVEIDNFSGGTIGGSAAINVNASGDITTQSDAQFLILNGGGGTIGSDATINVTANNISSASLFSDINNDVTTIDAGGSINGNATINFNLSGDLTTQGDASFTMGAFTGQAPETIGGAATINLSAANISTGGNLSFSIINGNGSIIGSDAAINLTAANISTGVELFASIDNNTGGIGGNATINLTAEGITANSLVAQIDTRQGTVGGNAAINMNVPGTTTVTTDATVAIYGSDAAASAAINFNGGSYDAGGTFLAFIDGDGAITFNNASVVHADVLKVGALGTNGVLNIGGGTLSADTTLELYASGSNGQLNFVSNVTLGGNSAKILAADSVTIFNNVVVTIGGSKPAAVYTGFTGEIPNANYTGFGGNGSTTGTFAGAGANDPQPLSKAPPFGPSSPTKSRVGINVSDSGQLLALLDGAVPGPGGKITIPASKIASNWRNSSRIDAASWLRRDRGAADIRTASSLLVRRLPQ